jgi:glycosyltransferase involved in cell wall biosynthesis
MYPSAEFPQAGPFIADQVESLRAAGVSVDVLHIDRTEGRHVYQGLGKKVRHRVAELEPDLVHVMYGGVMADAVTRAVRDRPVLVSFCGTDLLARRGDGFLGRVSVQYGALASRRAARRASGIIVKSANLYDALPADVDKSRTWIVPNGIDLSLFRPLDRGDCQRRLGWSAEKLHVLFPARIGRPEKRYGLARAAVEALGQPTVELHPLDGIPHEEVPIWLNGANVVLLTSAHEGSPNAVKEALACNVPVVSVDVGDVRERIAGIEGCFIAAASPSHLADSLAAALARTTPIDAREKISDLALEQVAERIHGIYTSLIGEAFERTGTEA